MHDVPYVLIPCVVGVLPLQAVERGSPSTPSYQWIVGFGAYGTA